MAGKVFFSVSMSLDGFSAPESMEGILATPEQREQDPRLERWMAQWMELQAWIFPQRFFRENLNLGEGGEEGRDNDIARETFERTGASVMGKRMFDLGEQSVDPGADDGRRRTCHVRAAVTRSTLRVTAKARGYDTATNSIPTMQSAK